MPTDIKLKNSVTATNAPTSLQQGEVAINITDKKVWVGNAATTPVQIVGAGSGGGAAAGSNTQVQFNSSGALAGSANLTFNGTTLILSSSGDGSKFTFSNGTSTGILFTNNTQVGLFESTAGNGYVILPASNALYLATNGAERMRITSAGDVGIGTSSPDVFSRGYGRILGISSASNSAIEINSATSFGSTIDMGVNSVRLFSIFSDASSSGLTTNTALPLFFATNSTERMRITSAGDVGIGTTSPLSKLDITSSNGTNPNADAASFLRLTNTASGVNSTSGVGFYASLGGTQFQTAYIQSVATFNANADSMLAFGTRSTSGAATERMRILSTGNILSLAGGSTTATGTGIAFPSTQDASTSANTLDDYEEGTWTPVVTPVSGTLTSYASNGYYVKVGRTVTITFGFTIITTGTASGRADVSGLPFTTLSPSGFGGGNRAATMIVREDGATGDFYAGYAGGGGNALQITTLAGLGGINWGSGYAYVCSFVYETNS
jgi:hypothetical protein